MGKVYNMRSIMVSDLCGGTSRRLRALQQFATHRWHVRAKALLRRPRTGCLLAPKVPLPPKFAVPGTSTLRTVASWHTSTS